MCEIAWESLQPAYPVPSERDWSFQKVLLPECMPHLCSEDARNRSLGYNQVPCLLQPGSTGPLGA